MIPASIMIHHENADQERDAESVDDALLRVASIAAFFRSTDGRFHARVPVENRHETFGLKSEEFRDWLIERYRGERTDLPPANAIARVLSALAARARFDDGTPVVQVRVGRVGDGSGPEFYIDLGNSSGQAIKLNAREWLAVDRPPCTSGGLKG